ncbi:hypothetical protein [Paenibacillus sp. 1A_MP2]|uniref:hypothetical protein n=1 Tax=Paenibacillus sp. 1A_MP2 TaxID=3457495 RepID=UPI003FCCD96D
MKEKKSRQLVSWRLEKLPDSEQLNKWVNGQSNVQNSLTSIVRHLIEQFGYQDVTSYDVQKVLFQKPIADELKLLISELKGIPFTSSVISSPSEVISESTPKHELPKEDNKANLKKDVAKDEKPDNDDIYKQIDPNNL